MFLKVGLHKKVAIAVIACLLLLFVPTAHAASFVDQYTVSSQLHSGNYVDYAVLFHPTINFFRITVVSVLSRTLLLINTTLTLDTHQQVSKLDVITVKGGNDTNTLVPVDLNNPNGTITRHFFLASTAISIPQYQFYVRFPFISTNLDINDFVNLDERAAAGFSTTSSIIVISSFGGIVSNYTFRSVAISYILTPSGYQNYWMWDKSTGFLLNYINAISLPHSFFFIDTNLWTSPSSHVYRPTSFYLYVLDLYYLLAFVGGLYFSYWELWLITFGAIGIYIFHGWLAKYWENRKRLSAAPHLKALLKKVESQDKKVLYLEEK